MAPVNFLLNVLWLVLGGFWMAVGWYLAGIVMFVTIIGIPWARSCFVIGNLSLWPFGKEVVNRELVTGREDMGTGGLGLVGNIIWFVLAGLWLAIGHILAAALNFVTIIGIPFGFQHLKLAMLALAPVGKTVVDKIYD
ncbi:YccF domain-containing protein [Desulfolutivibrio sulfoxidireducens]|uniref:YccF domain-containing protein n=1 Tax=Desulfolutivibrio sulfoxidireducens TaxID=2773299 RepID=UPI00159D4013|nr:YccF domain-containing protein [Desulfolutivibrio sulfoxidireducens]QLA16078.1 YccF domain-containing protein [Desulfolutivibrio sulfoxidireducens]QLA20012.1 YccF domain-containing protein [Desulfolutivibrio sulfoxidireducens]